MSTKLSTGIKGLATGTIAWFLIGGLICTFDGLFVLLRPRSLPGGDLATSGPLAPIFQGWHKYIEVDKRYADMDDAFVVLQSYLNMFEIAVGFIAVALSLSGARAMAHRVAIVISAITMEKTILYLALDYAEGLKYTKHNDTFTLVTMWLIPSCLWILFPLMVIVSSFSRLGTKGEIEVSVVAKNK
jgi:hypothetical protein